MLAVPRPATYVARFDTQDERGVHLLNAGRHDPATASNSLDEFLARTRKFGVKAEQKHLVIPSPEVSRIRKLAEV
ncbi:MAG TPA: hypothetical protein VGA78_16870 [Gemmatimonadales bacterium]